MRLTNEEYNALLDWTERNFIPTETINRRVCAYTIHGIFERLYDNGFYVTEYDVVRAMKECGYRAVESDGQVYFNVSNRSRALQIFFASLGPQTKDCKFEWM